MEVYYAFSIIIEYRTLSSTDAFRAIDGNYSCTIKYVGRGKRCGHKFTEDRADGVCWTYTISHTRTQSHTNTHWWHNSSMPGVQLVACSLALTVSCACVYPVLSLCERGPLFTSVCCQLGTKSQDKMVHARKHAHARTHTTLCCLFVQPMEGMKRGQTRRQRQRSKWKRVSV